jgi:hypothetical protein
MSEPDDDRTALPDGDYDAFVVDLGDELPQRVELTIIAGEFKGMVVTVASAKPLGSFVDLIGMPATISVIGGRPTIRIDD